MNYHIKSKHDEKRSRKTHKKRSLVWKFYARHENEPRSMIGTIKCKMCPWFTELNSDAKTQQKYEILRYHLTKTHPDELKEAESNNERRGETNNN